MGTVVETATVATPATDKIAAEAVAMTRDPVDFSEIPGPGPIQGAALRYDAHGPMSASFRGSFNSVFQTVV